MSYDERMIKFLHMLGGIGMTFGALFSYCAYTGQEWFFDLLFACRNLAGYSSRARENILKDPRMYNSMELPGVGRRYYRIHRFHWGRTLLAAVGVAIMGVSYYLFFVDLPAEHEQRSADRARAAASRAEAAARAAGR